MFNAWIITRHTSLVYTEMYKTDEDMEELTYDRFDSNFYEDLQLYKCFNEAGMNCDIIQISQLRPMVNKKENLTNLPHIAITRFNVWDEKDVYVLKVLESKGVIVINNYKSHDLCSNKWFQWEKLNSAGVSVPKTKLIHLYQYKEELSNNLTRDYINTIKFPLIVKPSNGSRGDNVHLCHSFDEIEKSLEKLIVAGYIQAVIQQYINTNDKGVISVFTMGGKAIMAQQRKSISKNDIFISNFRENSIRRNYEITDGLQKLCTDACTALNNIDMTRMDVLHDGTNYVICEVNSPGSFVSFDISLKTKFAKSAAEYSLGILQQKI